MNTHIVKLNTRIKNQKARIADLERQLEAAHFHAEEQQKKDVATTAKLEEEVAYQKRRVANRDKEVQK